MSTIDELITEALERSRKGVQEDDGYTYSIPASDIAATNDLLLRLAWALSVSGAPAADDETEWEYRIVDGDRIMYTDTVSRMMRAKLRGADVRRRRKAVNVPAGPWMPVESEEGASR